MDLVVRLLSVGVQGFQSYREEQVVALDERVTFLAGRNNVGKSAFLRAMRVFVEAQEGATDDFKITFRWEAKTAELLSAFQGTGHDKAHVEGWSRQQPRTHTLAASYQAAGRGDGSIGIYSGGGLKLRRLALEEIDAVASDPREVDQKTVWEAPSADVVVPPAAWLSGVAIRLAGRVRYVAPRRVEQGPRSLQPLPDLEPDGRNLAEVLLTLRSNYVGTTFAAVRKAMRRAFPEIGDLTVWLDESQPGGIVGEPAITYRNAPSRLVPLRLCGSGVEQMLSLVVGILTAKDPCVFLIDEPQAYLHPHAERMLLELIDQHPPHQFIIATHSNFLLGARPLSQSRLFTTTRQGFTRVTSTADHSELLDAIGLTAADLWLPDFIIWVEGPSELAAFSLLLDELGGEARRSARLHQMPAPASAFTGTPARRGRALFDFCDEVCDALAPTLPTTVFVFDLDEKSTHQRSKIRKASRDRAVFLGVRELENLFLDASVITPVLNRELARSGLEHVDVESVDAALSKLLTDSKNKKLFPRDPTAGKESREVRGSAVLDELWWQFGKARYDKATHADALVREALQTKPSLVQPLKALLAKIVPSA